MDFLPEKIERYIDAHSQQEPEVLQKLNRETHQKVLQPRMLSGHFQGRVLSMLSKIINPQYIIEVGTYTGYSAICLAEGMQANGVLHTIDKNEELYDIQRHFFDQAGFGEQIVQHTGDALEIIPTITEKFDIAFIDADKSNYINYAEMLIPKMNKGGIILTDNVLWSGKVTEPVKDGDIDTQTLVEYNKFMNADKRIETVLLPIRDGLSLTRVK